MSAGKYDFEVEQYVPFKRTLYYRAGPGEPTLVDLTGYRAHMQIRTESGTLVADLSTENEGVVLGGVAGTISLSISKELTSKMGFTKALYDLVLIPPLGASFRLLEGVVSLSKGQTR